MKKYLILIALLFLISCNDNQNSKEDSTKEPQQELQFDERDTLEATSPEGELPEGEYEHNGPIA
jgi:hypothetical protein